jgi:IclR family acetate operon transcriptional repressor
MNPNNPAPDLDGAVRDNSMNPSRRVIAVLESFGRRPRWGVRDLANELNISKSALHRTLQELSDEGILRIDEGGTYESSAGLMRLASLLAEASDLPRLARRHLQALRDATHETAILTAYDPQRRQFTAVAAVESSQAVRYISDSLTDWCELHLGASGKGILAFLPEAEQESILALLPEELQGARRITKDRLKQDLRVTRDRGWAVSRAERFAHARGVASPVRDATGRILGSVVVGWPDRPGTANRVPILGKMSRQTADAISSDLGWVATPLGSS